MRLKIEYGVYRPFPAGSGQYTLHAIMSDGHPMRPFNSEQEAMELVEELLQKEYGPFIVLPLYTRD